MILQSITLEGIGVFADRYTVGPLAPGVNIVHGPNGNGKSTVCRAVSLVFLESHRSKAAEIQALRPWGRRLTPQVEIEFEHGGKRYRARKRFLDSPLSQVDTHDGLNWTAFAVGDDADDFLREILQTDVERPRAAKREHWGLAQVLWTTQGDLSLPALAASVIENVRGSIGAQLSSRDGEIIARIQEEHERYFSPKAGRLKSGRNAARQVQLEKDVTRLTAELEAAESTLADFERESERIGILETRSEAARQHVGQLRRQLEQAQAQAVEFTSLQGEQRERKSKADAAEARSAAIRSELKNVAQLRAAIADADIELRRLDGQMPALNEARAKAEEALRSAETELSACRAEETRIAVELQAAHDAATYGRALQDRDNLAERLQQVQSCRERQTAWRRELSTVNAPEAEQLSQLRRLHAQAIDARRRLDLAVVKVGFTPDRTTVLTVIEGEATGRQICNEGEPACFHGTPNLKLQIDGVGLLEACGPVTDYQSVKAELENAEAHIKLLAAKFDGIDEVEIWQQRFETAARLRAQIAGADHQLAALRGGLSDAEMQHRARVAQDVAAELEQKYPDWVFQIPDAVAMRERAEAAVRPAAATRAQMERTVAQSRTALNHAELQVRLAAQRQDSTRREQATLAAQLARLLEEGFDEEQKRQSLQHAILEFEACTIALGRAEEALRRFASDPTAQAKALDGKLKAEENQAAQAREDLAGAKVRLETLVSRKPYSAVAELAEKLESAKEQLAREQARMAALALLRSTIEETRTEMMNAVAGPVERVATGYLTELCGRPLAAMRLTRDLTAKTAIPLALTESDEAEMLLEQFSGGEQEQIHLCTRLALGAELAKEQRQTLMLDDVLVATDEERMLRINSLLRRVAEDLQVIVFTCHPERFGTLKSAQWIEVSQQSTLVAAAR